MKIKELEPHVKKKLSEGAFDPSSINIPQHVIELMARALVKDARAAYDNPQIRQQYEEHIAAKRK